MKENNNAAEIQLSADNLHNINAALSKIKIEGERYPKELEKRTGL